MKQLLTIVSLWVLMVPLFGEGSLDWSGHWQTYWRDGSALLMLDQNGDRVRGTYPLYDGEVTGIVDDGVLQGEWRDSGEAGSFEFRMSPDGSSFIGRYGNGGWWTGSRLAADDVTYAGKGRYDSPRGTLRTFLIASNAARAGVMEEMEPALRALDFGDTLSTADDKIDNAKRLFTILDELTMQTYLLPGKGEEVEGGELRVELEQAGTGARISLDFVHQPEGWRIRMPSPGALEEMEAVVFSRREGRTKGASDHLHLDNARAAVRTFLEEFRNLGTPLEDALLGTMDFRHLGGNPTRQETRLLARYLKLVIDRVGMIIYQEISDDPQRGEPVVLFQHPVGLIRVSPVEDVDGQTRWVFDSATLRTIRELYAAVEALPEVDGIQNSADEGGFFAIRRQLGVHAPRLLNKILGAELWQWLLLGILIILSWLFSTVLAIGGAAVIRRAESMQQALPGKDAAQRLQRILRWVLLGGLTAGWIGFLGLPELYSVGIRQSALTLALLAACWMGFHFLHAAAVLNNQNLESETKNHQGVLWSLTIGLLRVSLLLVAILLMAEIWSVPYTSVLTGLGIGGVAVALATQSTLQNVISGFTLFADRPLSVGDFCRYGDNLGTVEKIGLRSVRIRTLDRSVVSIPTQKFADMPLENLGLRDRLLLKTVIGVRYETSADQLRYLQAAIRRMLVGHPKLLPEPGRVRFAGYGAFSLDLEIFVYVASSDWNEYLAVREDVMLRIMEIVEEAGTSMAFPSQTTYLARDTPNDPERMEEAERQIKRWRATGKLPLPDYADEDLERYEDELDYPESTSARIPKDEDDD